MKTCYTCKETKSQIEFAKDRKSKDGLQSHCKPCRRQYNLKRRNPPVMDGEKTCVKCQKTKHVAEFYPNRAVNDGRASVCKPCASAEASKRTAVTTDRRRRHINRWKLSKGCAHCGIKPANGQDLDLHHEDDDMKHTQVGNMMSMNLKRLIAEVRKCIVLCKPCHTVEHHRIKKETGRWAPTSSRPSVSQHLSY